MKEYSICVTRTTKVFDIVKIQASCPVEARKIARALAEQQDRAESLGEKPKKLTYEGKTYKKLTWDPDSVAFKTERKFYE